MAVPCVVWLVALAVTHAASLHQARADPILHKKLISSADNVHVGNWKITSKQVTPDCEVPWSVELRRLHGGKQEGVDLLIVNNGKLEITLIPTRGLGILSVVQGDLRLGWDSPVREIVHPRMINLQSRGGLGWLEGFNEWMCRCGMENNGQPGSDSFINNVGDKATMELTLHGKVANLPAQEVEIIIDGDPKKPTIRVQGRVDEKMVFGPKLELHASISTQVGSSKFRIADEVVNAGAQPQEFQMLYHCNFGTPLLGKGTKFVAPLSRVVPYNQRAARDLKTFNAYLPPTPGYIEQVYLLEPLADAAGNTRVLLHNAQKNRGASLSYSLKELPYLTLWKNTGAREDGYVTGIEPGTNYPNRRVIERKAGRVPKLAAGAKHAMSLVVELHATPDEVAGVLHAINKIQGKRNIQLESTPAN